MTFCGCVFSSHSKRSVSANFPTELKDGKRFIINGVPPLRLPLYLAGDCRCRKRHTQLAIILWRRRERERLPPGPILSLAASQTRQTRLGTGLIYWSCQTAGSLLPPVVNVKCCIIHSYFHFHFKILRTLPRPALGTKCIYDGRVRAGNPRENSTTVTKNLFFVGYDSSSGLSLALSYSLWS